MTLEELNTYVETGDIDELIRVDEARQCKALAHIADEITSRGDVRLVLLAGEKIWINPFRGGADAEFDSALSYELAVLKPYVAGLLELVRRQNPDEVKARFLLELLSCVRETDPTRVPGDSILRETIGGSLLDY